MYLEGKKILLLSESSKLAKKLEKIAVKYSNSMVFSFSDEKQALFYIYNSPPDIILVDYRNFIDKKRNFINTLKKDNVFGHLPIVLFVNKNTSIYNPNLIEDLIFDDYILLPIEDDEDILLRLNLVVFRTFRELDANPLTRLPGNTSIIKELEKRIASGEKFAVCYTDLDNFKAFNDKYGFLRGDEVIRLAAGIIVNAVYSIEKKDTFVGHIGGDDFVFIIPPEEVENVCTQIINNFDLIIPSLYDPEDKEKGYIISRDRQGKKVKFPIISISIAVVTNVHRDIKHPGEISAIAASLKKLAKNKKGSVFVVDRRKK